MLILRILLPILFLQKVMGGIYELVGVLSDHIWRERGEARLQLVAPATPTPFIILILGAAYVEFSKTDVHTLQ